MMRNMGWHGGSLGDGTGIVEPITGGRAGGGRAGLGHPNRPREPSTDKTNRKEKKIIYCGYLGAQGKPKYAKVIDETHVEVIQISPLGKPIPSGVVERVHPRERRDLLFSRGGVLGIAESTYPHPAGWTFEGADKGTLETLTVRQLTGVFRNLAEPRIEPTCVKAWQARLGKIDFNLIASRYSTGLLTPKDYAPHFKNILHRRIFVRHINPEARSHSCRCCRRATETTLHLGECVRINEVLQNIWRVTETRVTPSPQLNLFALSDAPLPLGVTSLFMITWKFILIAFTKADIIKEAFLPEQVWKGAIRRLISRVERLKMQVRVANTIAMSKDLENIPGLASYNKQVAGLGAFSESGIFRYSDTLWNEIKKHDLTKYSSA